MGEETPPFPLMITGYTVKELQYMILAVERMAPLAHHPEATLQGRILAYLRADLQKLVNRERA